MDKQPVLLLNLEDLFDPEIFFTGHAQYILVGLDIKLLWQDGVCKKERSREQILPWKAALLVAIIMSTPGRTPPTVHITSIKSSLSYDWIHNNR